MQNEPRPKLSAEERARRYMEKMPPAVEGCNGDDATYSAAKALVVSFDLPQDVALPILADWNLRCDPPWKDDELRRKLNQAEKYKAKNAAQVGKLLGMSYDEHERLRKEGGGSKRKTPQKKTWRPRLRTPANRIPERPAEEVRHGGRVAVELPDFANPAEPAEVGDTGQAAPLEETLEGCPIVTVYGGKAALWKRMKEELRRVLHAEGKALGRSCNMPGAVRIDARVAAKLPPKIDVFRVIADEREGVVEFDWEGSPK